MELHLFIFLATKSGPASFQPFSHPPSRPAPHSASADRPCGLEPGQTRGRACCCRRCGAPLKTRTQQSGAQIHVPKYRWHLGLSIAHFRDLHTEGDFWPKRAEWVCRVLYYCISYQIVEFCVICGIWLDYKKKQNGIKENMEEEGSGVIGSPLYSSQKVHYKTKIEPLVKNFFFLNFDYTAGLVCEYGNKHNL